MHARPSGVPRLVLVAGIVAALGLMAMPPRFVDAQGTHGAEPSRMLFVGLTFPVGQHIGYHHEGMFKARQFAHVLTQDLATTWSLQAKEVMAGVLRKAGLGAEAPSSVFANAVAPEGRFALGGTVLALSVNTYGAFAGKRTLATVTVRWELLDRSTNRVVFGTSSAGEGQRSGSDVGALGDALVHSMNDVIVDTAFMAAIRARQTTGATETGFAHPDTMPQSIVAASAIAGYASLEGTAGSDIIRLPEVGSDSVARIGELARSTFSIRLSDGHGSGVIISRDGLALTNRHVVEGVTSFEARLANRRVVQGRVVRVSDRTDAALVQLACGDDCLPAPLGRLADIEPGADVYAVGTPFDLSLQQSITRGVVSGVRRIDGATFVQTDAALSPGNSGGPLFDRSSGRVIAINTFKLRDARTEALNFALAIDDVLSALGVVATPQRR